MKTLVTKSIRSLMKRMKSLPRSPPDRSARFVNSRPYLRPPFISTCLSRVLLLLNRRSPLRRLRGVNPHHLRRSRLQSPSKRMRKKSEHHGPRLFKLAVSVLISRFSLFRKHILLCRDTLSVSQISNYIGVLFRIHYRNISILLPGK